MAELTREQKKELAKMKYLHEHLQQKEIAKIVGVSVQTMTKWVKDGGWDKLKVSITITREEQLANLYRQIAEINSAIANRNEGERYATSKEADTINKLAAAIEKMEREIGIADIISVSKGILSFICRFDPGKARDLSYLFDDYIKERMK